MEWTYRQIKNKRCTDKVKKGEIAVVTARERLFSYKKIYDQNGSQKLFVKAMRESIEHHSDNCEFYGKFLSENGFKASDIKSIEDCDPTDNRPVF